MTNYAKEISICNDALALVGHEAIHDFESKTPASEVAGRLYELVLANVLEAYPWRFAMRQACLNLLTERPKTNYLYSHALPPDRDGTPRRFYIDTYGNPAVNIEIFEGKIHSNYKNVYCDYVKRGALSGPFRNLLVRALASDFAIALCDDRGLHDRFQSTAYGTPREGGKGGLFKTAISNDAQGAQTRSILRIGAGPLVEAHNS